MLLYNWKGIDGMFLVNRIKRFYRTKPSLYRNLCFILSKLPYFIYLFSLLILSLFIGGVYLFTIHADASIHAYIGFSIAALLSAFILLRIFFIKSIKIKGLNVSEEKFKKIWELIEKLTEEFKGIKVHKIIIVDKCRVEIISQRKFGFIGKKTNSLLIGLPILMGFNEKEFKNIIGTVICRNSKTHKITDKSIRKTYFRLEHLFSNDKKIIKTNVVFDVFIGFILKRFYLFYREIAIMEIKEIYIKADKIFLEKYSVDELANIILKRYVHRYLIEEVFLKNINKNIELEGEPPKNVFTAMNEYLNESINVRDIIEALRILKNYDKKDISYIGTPIDRVEKINYNIGEFQYEFGDSSVRLLGKDFDKVVKAFNLNVHKESKKRIESSLKCIISEREAYDRLSKAFSIFDLREKDFIAYITLREKFAGVNTAIIEGKKLCISYPQNSEIKLMVGRLLLKGNNSQGVEYIKNAINVNPLVSIEGYKDIIEYYIRKEEYELASNYKKEYNSLKSDCRDALKEREKPSLKELRYENIDLDREILIAIIEVLKTKGNIKMAYISKIKVKKFKDIPHYVLWVSYKAHFFTMEETFRKRDRDIRESIELNNITVIHTNGDNCYMKVPLRKINKYKILGKRKRNFH